MLNEGLHLAQMVLNLEIETFHCFGEAKSRIIGENKLIRVYDLAECGMIEEVVCIWIRFHHMLRANHGFAGLISR